MKTLAVRLVGGEVVITNTASDSLPNAAATALGTFNYVEGKGLVNRATGAIVIDIGCEQDIAIRWPKQWKARKI